MTSLNMLEELRSKEELVNYFERKGQNITEEEIENLKKNYEQTEKDNGTLNLQQLNEVAGGTIDLDLMHLTFRGKKLDFKNNPSYAFSIIETGSLLTSEQKARLTPDEIIDKKNHCNLEERSVLAEYICQYADYFIQNCTPEQKNQTLGLIMLSAAFTENRVVYDTANSQYAGDRSYLGYNFLLEQVQTLKAELLS